MQTFDMGLWLVAVPRKGERERERERERETCERALHAGDETFAREIRSNLDKHTGEASR